MEHDSNAVRDLWISQSGMEKCYGLLWRSHGDVEFIGVNLGFMCHKHSGRGHTRVEYFPIAIPRFCMDLFSA